MVDENLQTHVYYYIIYVSIKIVEVNYGMFYNKNNYKCHSLEGKQGGMI